MKSPQNDQAQRQPLAKLSRLGTLDDVVESQASPELKAACVDMGREAAERRGSKPTTGEDQA